MAYKAMATSTTLAACIGYSLFLVALGGGVAWLGWRLLADDNRM